MIARASLVKELIGRKIQSASSSLQCFTIVLDDGSGLVVSAVDSAEPLDARIVSAAELPSHNEAVCSVDWGWITGSSVKTGQLTADRLALQLDPAGPLNILTGMWQGSPYLAFQPYKPKSG
jgi:hypothetical protein